MAADEPPYLTVGTDVSAKYKGAFCEAKIKKVNRMVKCKVTFKNNLGSALVPDDQIKGILRIGAEVEARHPEKNQFADAVINKLQDYSQYTVVFDDGDETTLRRTSLCLKSGRHFAESPTLDQFPLTNPEHFGTPVIGSGKSKRKRRSTMNSASLDYDSSDEELHIKKNKISRGKERDPDLGKVVCVEYGDRRKKECWYPGLVVASPLQDNFKINAKEEYLIRSFKDGKYYQVPKKDTREFTPEIGQKVESNTLRTAVEKAMLYYEKEELPPHWDKALYMGLETPSAEEESHDSDSDTPDDEPSEEKDRFVAQLYKFMDERGTPINKAPTVGSRDLNLYKLFKIMHKMGGYNRVTNQNQWKVVYTKMGLPPSNPAGSNQIKVAYKRYLHSFEDFYRKLGCTMVTNSRSTRVRHRSDRNFIITRNRDRDISTSKGKSSSKDKCLGEKKSEEKLKMEECKKTEIKSKNEEVPKPDEKPKTLDKKKNEKPTKLEEKDEKSKPKKSEEKARLVRSQSVNKEKKEIKNREDEKKESKPEKARTREDARKEKAESPEKKETRASVKIEQERERREREETEKKDGEQTKEKKERLAKEKDKKEEKCLKKEEKQIKEITEDKCRDKKEDRLLKDKKEDKPVREKKEEKLIKDKREEKSLKDKREEKLPKDKKEERSPKDKKDEKGAKELLKDKKDEKGAKDSLKDKKDEKGAKESLKDKKEEKTAKDSCKDKKDEKSAKDKKEEKLFKDKRDEKTPGKFAKDEKLSKVENDGKVSEKTPLKDKKEAKFVKEKKGVFLKERGEEKLIKRENVLQKEKNDVKPQKKEEKDNETENVLPFVEETYENLDKDDKIVKTRNDLDDNQLKQVKKKSGKTEEREEPRSGLQPNDSDDDDLPLALEKMMDKKDCKEGEIEIGDKVKVKYGRGRMKKLYEAKVLKTDKDGSDRRYYVHYSGWNMRYDEWIRKSSIVENMSEKNRVARKTKQILNAKAQNFLAQVSLKREKGRLPGPLVSSKLNRKSSTSSTNSTVSCSRTTRSDKNSLSTSPYSAGLEPRKRARKKSGLSVALTDTSQDSESDIDHMSFDPDDDGDELEDHSNHSEINCKQEVLSDTEGERETIGCEKEFKTSESVAVANSSCDFKETQTEIPIIEEKSPPVLSSIDDQKVSENAVREEFYKETVPDIVETKHDDDDDGGNIPKMELKCENSMLCYDTDSAKDMKKNDDSFEKEQVENQLEDRNLCRPANCKDVDVQQCSTSKPSKKCSRLVDSFIDLQKSAVKLLTSKTLTKTLNVAIKDIASEYDFNTWNEISEKKDSVKLPDTLVKESTISVSCTESDDEKMEVSQEYLLTEPEMEKEDKFSDDEITENKDVMELVCSGESKDTFKNEGSLTDSSRLVEIDRKEVSAETDTKCIKNIHEEEEETIHCSISPVEHLDESSKSSSVNILDNSDITEGTSEVSKPEGIIPVDVCKYEDLIVIDDSTVERSDEEFKTDNEFDIEKKPHETSNADDKVHMPHTETSSAKMDGEIPETSSDTVPTIEKELICKQQAESCGLLPTLEIPSCSNEARDTFTDLPTIDKFSEKDEPVHFESFNISCSEQELQKQKDDNDNSDHGNEEGGKEIIPEKSEETCIKESKDLERLPVISSTGFSEVCSSESFETSAVVLAAAAATSVATVVPLPLHFSEESIAPCVSGASEIVEVVTEVPHEVAKSNKCDGKSSERSIEQKFVEVVFQNLEKRDKREGETTTAQSEVNSNIKTCDSVLQLPSNEQKDLSSECGKDHIIKESMSYMDNTLGNNNVSKDETYEAEDLSTTKMCDVSQLKGATEIQGILAHKIDLNLSDKLTMFEEPLLKPLDCSFMRSLGEVADMFLESHNASEAGKDLNTNRNDMSNVGSVLKKESKKKKTKLSKLEKKMSGVDFLDREEGKATKSKSKKKKNEHDDFEKSRDPELKTKSKKLKKNKNKKKLSKHDDASGDPWKKIEGKDEENTEKVRKKDKRKREEKKIGKSDSKNEDSWEMKVLDSSKKEKKKGKKKDRMSSEKRAELFEKRVKKKKKLHFEDNFDSDSEKESRLSRKEKKREKKKVKSKDSSSSDDCTERLVKDLPFEQPENLSSFGSQLIIPSTYQREDSVKSDDPDMSFLLCKEKVPASPEDANIVPEDTSNSSIMEENNSLVGQASSDSEKIEAIVMDSYPRHEDLEPPHRHDTEACAVLDNTPPTTPSSTESLLSSSPSHERESYALHYPESTRSGRESGEGESDSLQCEPSGIEATDSEEYRAAATLAFAVCKSVPEKTKETSRVSLKRQKSECDDLSPTKHHKKSKRHSLSESSKHSRHRAVSRSMGGDDDYDSSGANSVTAVTSPAHSSCSVQNASLTSASSQHLTTTQAVTTHAPTRPSKFNFYVPLDDYKDADKRIAVIQEKLSELKRTYMSLKAEVALIDRRRKKAKKKEKEAGSATSNPSSHLEEVQCSS